MSGTIDTEGFREDLQSIAQNSYPKLQLVKLPFNWFVPETSGILQHHMGTETVATVLTNVHVGSRIVVFTNNQGGTGGGSPTTVTVTDSGGNTYTQLSQYFGAFTETQIDLFETTVTVGGALTLVVAIVGGNPFYICEACEVGGVTSRGGYATAGANFAIGVRPAGQLLINFASLMTATPQLWVQNGPQWAALDINTPTPNSLETAASWSLTSDGVTAIAADANITGYGGNPIGQAYMSYNLASGSGAGVPAPQTPIPLVGPCNFLSLVSEAIDEQGVHQESALIGQQAAAGFVRFNGPGNVWIPVAFASPLTPGFVTTQNNYTNNPIIGTGFSSVQAPFGRLEFQPALPIYYSGTPPTTTTQFLLAFVGLNVGVYSGIGAGKGNTYAIPSAAGPIKRRKKACLL